MSETIQFRLNGNTVEAPCEGSQTLLFLLREKLGKTGSKDGCSSGDCGACVVLKDGMPVNACMVLAGQAEDCDITTVEGLAGETLHPLQKAFGERWAFQCGFCTPGMLISCYSLLQSNPQPSRDEVLEAVSGNFCRCTGYQHVVDAVLLAAEQLRSDKEKNDV